MQPAANVATKGNGQNVQKRVFIVLPSIALDLFFTIARTGRDSSSTTETIQLNTIASANKYQQPLGAPSSPRLCFCG